jgi:hypothetical protein
VEFIKELYLLYISRGDRELSWVQDCHAQHLALSPWCLAAKFKQGCRCCQALPPFAVNLRPAEVSRSRSRIWARWIASFSASLWPEHCMWQRRVRACFGLGHARVTRKERLWLNGPGNVRWKWAKWVIKWQSSQIFCSFSFLFVSIFRKSLIHKATKCQGACSNT